MSVVVHVVVLKQNRLSRLNTAQNLINRLREVEIELIKLFLEHDVLLCFSEAQLPIVVN